MSNQKKSFFQTHLVIYHPFSKTLKKIVKNKIIELPYGFLFSDRVYKN